MRRFQRGRAKPKAGRSGATLWLHSLRPPVRISILSTITKQTPRWVSVSKGWQKPFSPTRSCTKYCEREEKRLICGNLIKRNGGLSRFFLSVCSVPFCRKWSAAFFDSLTDTPLGVCFVGAPGEIRTLAHARSGFGSQAPLGPDSLPNPVRISLISITKQTSRWDVCFLGAPGGVRTHDLPVRSRALYPLSYGRIWTFRFDPERLFIVAIRGRNVKRKNVILGRENQTGRSSAWLMTVVMPAFLIIRAHMTQGSGAFMGAPFSKP